MNATSTEEFKDIIAIDFELQTFPNPDVQDKFIVSATNRDDIFAFVFEGPNLRDACRNAGLFVGWEKDQKIRELLRELQEENKDLKKRYDRLNKKFNRVMNDNLPETPITDSMLVDDCNRLVEENKKLKEDLNKENTAFKFAKRSAEYWADKARNLKNLKKDLSLEKAANEAQHKFIREYAGKGTEVQFNYAIDDAKEVSYVVVDKEENERIKENLQSQHKMILELNKANCENCADEEVVDNVNHPSHYTGKYECIDVMQDVFGDEATNDFCLCNAFKYIWRARKKNGLEDVKKAVWYLNKYIEEAEKDGVPKGK